MKVTVQAFDRRRPDLATVCSFKARTDSRTLTEAGITFTARGGALDAEKLGTAKPRKKQKIVVNDNAAEVLQKESPVLFELRYNGKAQEIVNGRVPSPRKKDKVSFVLKHRDPKDKQTYGVVLKVNGESTLFPTEDDEPDDVYRYKWIIKPGSVTEVKGYQISEKELNPFEVDPLLDDEEAKANYGPHAGTFQVIIYRAKQHAKDQPEDFQPDEQLRPIGRGTFLAIDVVPDSLKSLQDKLRHPKREGGRGLSRGYIGPAAGARAAKVNVETFKAYEVPEYSVTVRYQGSGK
jgi:hypothetical protein